MENRELRLALTVIKDNLLLTLTKFLHIFKQLLILYFGPRSFVYFRIQGIHPPTKIMPRFEKNNITYILEWAPPSLSALLRITANAFVLWPKEQKAHSPLPFKRVEPEENAVLNMSRPRTSAAWSNSRIWSSQTMNCETGLFPKWLCKKDSVEFSSCEVAPFL